MTSSAPSLLAHATRDLAEFAARTVYDDIPPAVIERVKLSFMDGLGACLHGATLPWTQRVRDVVQEEGGSPVASLWGSGTRTSVTGAVLVNSTAGHGFEMDDIHKESVIHPNSLAVPVALALAEADRTLTGRDIVTAVTLGYEVGLRIGNAATTSLLLNGFHPQGTTGAFVAAAIAGRLLKLDPEQMQNALGIAGSLGAGLTAAQEGAMVKRLHAGRAAQSGVLGALLAKKGFTGIPNIVEASSGGFLSAFARTPNIERLMAGLGSDWEAGKLGFKLYPNATSMHTALDGLRDILLDHHLPFPQIEEIRVGCSHPTLVHTAWEYRPVGITAAQMNMCYGLAVMALRGDVSASNYCEATISDPAVLAFIPRITVAVDHELESMGPVFRHAARVAVRTTEGKTFTREILHRRGSPENPVNLPDIERKFASNVGALLGPAKSHRLKQLAAELDRLANADEIVEIVRAPSKT